MDMSEKGRRPIESSGKFVQPVGAIELRFCYDLDDGKEDIKKKKFTMIRNKNWPSKAGYDIIMPMSDAPGSPRPRQAHIIAAEQSRPQPGISSLAAADRSKAKR
jgi:hypothetical protein